MLLAQVNELKEQLATVTQQMKAAPSSTPAPSQGAQGPEQKKEVAKKAEKKKKRKKKNPAPKKQTKNVVAAGDRLRVHFKSGQHGQVLLMCVCTLCTRVSFRCHLSRSPRNGILAS